MTSFAAACATDSPQGSRRISVQGSADEELIALVRRRDREAFGTLLNRYLDGMHRYVLRMTGSSADAEEITQEAFLRVWQKAHTYKPAHGKVSTWLYRIAHNLCVDDFRKPRPNPDSEAVEAAVDVTENFDAAVHRDEQMATLHAALASLPENQRSALMLCQVQGFSNREAATVLGVGVRALESLLARARRNVRAVFDDVTMCGQTMGSSNEHR